MPAKKKTAKKAARKTAKPTKSFEESLWDTAIKIDSALTAEEANISSPGIVVRRAVESEIQCLKTLCSTLISHYISLSIKV